MYPKELNGLEILGVYVHEPGGVWSNFLIVLTCLFLIYRLDKPSSDFQLYWRYFIVFIGLGAAGGMISHGFPTYLGETGFYWVWGIKSAFIPVANVFAALGVLSERKDILQKGKPWLWVKAGVVTVLFMIVYDFLPVVIDLLLTYILVLIYANKYRKSMKAYAHIFAAFVFALVTGLLYPFKIDFHELWFTHKDVAHIFAAISLIWVYHAIRSYHQEKV